jgi:hypothetical protein
MEKIMERVILILSMALMLAFPVYADEITISGAHTEGGGVTTGMNPDGTRGLTILTNSFYNPAPGENGLHFVANQAKIAENGKSAFVLNNVNYSVYAGGIAATVNNVAATLDFTGDGSIDPFVTLASPGTYLILGKAQLKYNAATFTAPQTCQIYLFRTNNTPAVLTNAITTLPLRILTAVTDNGGAAVIPPILYTTTNTNDTIAIYGLLSAPVSAGSFQATEASIVAIRLY